MKLLKSKTSPLKFLAIGLFIIAGFSMVLSSTGSPSRQTIRDCTASSSDCVTSNAVLTVFSGRGGGGASTSTTKSTSTKTEPAANTVTTQYGCGSNNDQPDVYTSIDFGCYGDACANGHPTAYCDTTHSAITDLLFAIIRFLSKGVGIVVIGSIIVGGIQYVGSRGEPNSTSMAIARIRGSVIALIIFIFAYAILNYVVPAGFFSQTGFIR